jgi:hypothetical protein
MSIGAPHYRDENIETLSGNKTLVVNDAFLQALDPGGSGRNIVLPAERKGLSVVVANTADGSEVLTIQEDAGSTTICTPTQNETATLWCDGTTWHGSVGDSA